MPRKQSAQLNIRSDYARERVAELAAETGKSATQVVEDAIRAYRPPPPVDEVLPPGLVRDGKLLVLAAQGRKPTTMDETLAGIDEDRNRELFYD